MSWNVSICIFVVVGIIDVTDEDLIWIKVLRVAPYSVLWNESYLKLFLVPWIKNKCMGKMYVNTNVDESGEICSDNGFLGVCDGKLLTGVNVLEDEDPSETR